MNRFLISSILLVALFGVISEASLFQQLVKNGERVIIDGYTGAKAISRRVPAGEQIFHFEGEFKGSFVNSNGEKIASSNYEIENGALVIKKFTDADEGLYEEYPPKENLQKDGDDFYELPGPALQISIA